MDFQGVPMTDRRQRSRSNFEGLCDAHSLLSSRCQTFQLPWYWKIPFIGDKHWEAYQRLVRIEDYVYRQMLVEGWYV
jgi:hypothetical protein